MWSASGDERGTKSGVSTISLERLQCARRDFSGPTERRKRTPFVMPNSNYIIVASD
jgi:hypothetical protein